jgi:arsenical pump membrane protein
VGPILAFLVCVTIVAELADGLGVFSTLAHGAAQTGPGLGARIVAAHRRGGRHRNCRAFSRHHRSAGHPVVLALARQLDLDVALFAYTAVWLANTASLFLPVSNLTNCSPQRTATS